MNPAARRVIRAIYFMHTILTFLDIIAWLYAAFLVLRMVVNFCHLNTADPCIIQDARVAAIWHSVGRFVLCGAWLVASYLLT